MPCRVLVVDDQPVWTDVLGLLIGLDERFELAGTAAQGLEGITAARSDPPDAIVCDAHMPVLDGLQALPVLRASCPDATIVIHTSDPAGARDAVKFGADAVVDKATGPVALLELLARMWRQRDMPEGAKGAPHACRSELQRAQERQAAPAIGVAWPS